MDTLYTVCDDVEGVLEAAGHPPDIGNGSSPLRGPVTLGPSPLGAELRTRVTREFGPDAMGYSPTQTLRDGPCVEAATLLPMKSSLDEDDLKVLRRLGRGGSGVVEAAEQTSLGRKVALKHVHFPDDQRSVATLLREAEITARLSHPSIVPVHHIFEDADLGPVVVMGLLEGRTWRSLINDPKTPDYSARAIRTAIEVCFALEYAHSQSVLHLDVKPDNVILGSFGEVYLIDWGIAMDLRNEPTRNLLKGTPAYMAPEMLTPETTPITERTDVYLLAGSLLEALTGRCPHPSATLLGAMQEASRPVDVPSDRVAPSLVGTLQRALQADPDQRFQSVAELRLALEAHLAHRDADRLLLAIQLDWRALQAEQNGTRERYLQLFRRLDAAEALWPDNEAIPSLRATLSAAWLAKALREDDLVGAAQAARGVRREDHHSMSLVSELEARQQELQRAGDHLRRLQRQLDLGHKVRQRRGAFATLLAVFFVFPSILFLSDPRWAPHSTPVMFVLALGCSLIWGGILLCWRNALSSTYASREAIHTITLCAMGVCVHRAWAVYTDQDPVHVGQLDLMIYALALASRSYLHRIFRVSAVYMVGCFAVAAVWPFTTRLLLTLGPVGVLAMLVFVSDRIPRFDRSSAGDR